MDTQEPPPRFQLTLSRCVVVMCVLGGLLGMNLRSCRVPDGNEESATGVVAGWPCQFYRSTTAEDYSVGGLEFTGLFLNLIWWTAILFFGLSVEAWIEEWIRIRRGEKPEPEQDQS